MGNINNTHCSSVTRKKKPPQRRFQLPTQRTLNQPSTHLLSNGGGAQSAPALQLHCGSMRSGKLPLVLSPKSLPPPWSWRHGGRRRGGIVLGDGSAHIACGCSASNAPGWQWAWSAEPRQAPCRSKRGRQPSGPCLPWRSRPYARLSPCHLGPCRCRCLEGEKMTCGEKKRKRKREM